MNGDFRRFWLGQTVSLFGSQVTFLALPMTAILALHASPLQLGLLGFAAFAPYLVLTLPAGAWIDRRRRRPILLVSNLARAGLIAIVPIDAVFGTLSFPLLIAVALGMGVFSVLFEVAYQAYLPALVDRGDLAAANARLVGSMSAASVGGPGLGGMLVSIAGAPFALLADAASYVVAGLSLAGIRRTEPIPGGPPVRNMRAEIAEGLRVTFGHGLLRAFALEAAAYNLFTSAITTVFLLFATRELGLEPAMVGMLFAIGAVGSVVGSLVARPMGARFGFGRTIAFAMLVACLPFIALPFAGGPKPLAATIVGAVFVLDGLGVSIATVYVLTIRQAATPNRLLARMNASYRALGYGVIPIGALLGGAAAEVLGLRTALLLAAAGVAAAPLFVVLSPIVRFRNVDEVVAAIRAGSFAAESEPRPAAEEGRPGFAMPAGSMVAGATDGP